MVDPVATACSQASVCRLALVTTELRVGGAEKCLTELAKRLDKSRYEVRVVCLADPPARPRDRLWQELMEAGIQVDALGLRHPRQWFAAVHRLKQSWQQWRPHVVQSFLFHADVLAARVTKSLSIECHNLGLRVSDPSRFRSWLERRAAKKAQGVVCVSEKVAADAETRHRIPRNKLIVIPNGVDIESITQVRPADLSATGIAEDRVVVSVIGRLEPQKGLSVLMNNVDPFLTANPHAHLLFVGEGSQEKQLLRLATELGLADRITFVGWRKDVAAIMKSSRLLLLPSRYEGMPNVVMEAMAAGRPVAAFDVEGVSELLGESPEQIAAAGDYGTLFRIAGHMVQDGDLADSLGMRNQRLVRENHSIECMVDAYDQLFRRQFHHIAP